MKSAIVLRKDLTHLPRIRAALKEMRAACRARGIENPVDILVPDDALLDNMPTEMLEQAAVLCAWPGVDIRIGGPKGKIQEGTGARGRVLIFHNREHTIHAAVEILEHTVKLIKGENASAPNITQ
jgi:hypothetical protein